MDVDPYNIIMKSDIPKMSILVKMNTFQVLSASKTEFIYHWYKEKQTGKICKYYSLEIQFKMYMYWSTKKSNLAGI